MKNFNKTLYLFLSLFFTLFIGAPEMFSQDKTNDNQELKKPPTLLKFKESERISLQNSSQLFKNVFDASEKTSFVSIKQEQDNLGFIHIKNHKPQLAQTSSGYQ